MAESSPTAAVLEQLLARIEDARTGFIATLERCDPQLFGVPAEDGESLKTTLDRASDDVNFYYGRLAAKALSLPQPPCLTKADFGSLREGTVALQVAHRRLGNLLHDLQPADLERQAADAELGNYSLRQVLEMAAAHYNLRAQQVERICQQVAEAKQ